jgi:hypothetical protein
MKRWLCLSGLLIGCATAVGATPDTLKLTAYINVASGCQRPTEALLKDLVAKYPGRIAVEVIDFGSPEGRRRWLADGQHCMAILLDGSPKMDIVFKGATVTVAFHMPPGHGWLLEELETAVRQKLNGVSEQDRKGPAITTRADAAGGGSVLADGRAILDRVTMAEAERVTSRLQTEASAKPLLQDDFTLDIVEGTATVSLRGASLADFGLVAIPAPADAEAQATARFLRLIEPFPRLTRPFPGVATPMGQQQQKQE